MNRSANITRETRETKIDIDLLIDGSGNAKIQTGIGFFDHMLEGFARHGFFDLLCIVEGDLEVDAHHTVEDTGIVLGQAIAKALGEKKGIKRYGSVILPMDEALCLCAIDLSNRPYLQMDVSFDTPKVGDMDTELIQEFFYAISYASGMNLHFQMLAGKNTHHMIEVMFKAFAKALDEATKLEKRLQGTILSTKGRL